MTAILTSNVEQHEQLKLAVEAHKIQFDKPDVSLLPKSPWYPSLLKVIGLLGDYFTSDKSPASLKSKEYVSSKLKVLRGGANDAIMSMEFNGVDSCILQIAYPLIHTIIISKFVPPIDELVSLTAELNNDDKVAAILADNQDLVDAIGRQMEEILYSVIDHLEESEQGKELLAEIEASKEAKDLGPEVRDEIDLAIIEQLLAVARHILQDSAASDDGDKVDDKNHDASTADDKFVETAALEHVLELLTQVLERLRNDDELWNQVRYVCIDPDVTPSKLQGTLLATVNYALAQVFDSMPTEEDFRKKFIDYVNEVNP